MGSHRSHPERSAEPASRVRATVGTLRRPDEGARSKVGGPAGDGRALAVHRPFPDRSPSVRSWIATVRTMVRTVARTGSRGYGRAAAVGAVASAAILVAVLLSALLGARDHPQPAVAAPFPPSQAVPVTIDRLQRVVGNGVIAWSLPDPYAGPRDVAVTASAVWVTEQNKGAVDAFGDGKLIRYEVDAKFPNSGAFGLAPGPSGSVWFTGYPNGNVGRLLPDGTVNSFSPIVDTAGTVAAVEDPNGSMWVTDVNLGVVVRIDQQGQVAAFPVPPPTSTRELVGPYDIAATPDGAIWFTDPRDPFDRDDHRLGCDPDDRGAPGSGRDRCRGASPSAPTARYGSRSPRSASAGSTRPVPSGRSVFASGTMRSTTSPSRRTGRSG